MRSALFARLIALAGLANGVNFPFESSQLQSEDIGNFSAIDFGTLSNAAPATACRAYPGTADWPATDEWLQLNTSLGGALLHPRPIAAVCYDGPDRNQALCDSLMKNAATSRLYLDDPLTVLDAWPEGGTCYATSNPQGVNCTQGAYPVYVVNATSVKHIQIAVNFARNRNLRLVIKNSGHDWLGRSVGFGSLSIWTHYLKDFEFVPEFQQGDYQGMAARVATGLESWQMHAYMNANNMTLVVPGSYTIAPWGGWVAGGGHSPLASYHGLGADQVLSLEVVTADGRFVTATPDNNSDLFFAMRGGGGSTNGIVTSAIVKAHPFVGVMRTSLTFSVKNASNPDEVNRFWKGIALYYQFGPTLVDGGGTAYGDISLTNPSNNNSFTFSTQFEMPAMSAQQLFNFTQPLFDDLNAAGIPVNNSQPVPSTRWSSGNNGLGDTPSASRFGSRLFPRANFEDDELFNTTLEAVRQVVEAGYTFHGIHMQPTENIGKPVNGSNAVNPAFRKAIMHADLFDNAQLRGATPEYWISSYQQFNSSMAKLRAVTAGSGAYINEADGLEPNWQQAFFGSNYERLLQIKKSRDPWGLFYAPTTVGSEAWEVRTADGLPTQNGPLCRVGN